MKNGLSQVFMMASRELRDQMRDWRILFPMLVLTIFFPYLMNATAKIAVDFINEYGGGLIAERIIPFLLMVVGFFPITISLVVALEAFVGEKERGTIEPLLSSPLADWQLYLGKLIAGTVVPLFSAYVGITVYLVGIYFQGIKVPEPILLFQTVILTSVQAILMVSGALVISAQSTSVRAANLLASFIIIPVALLIQGESVLMFWGNNNTLWYAVIGVSILAGLLVRLGLAHFQRESLIGREIDMLNFRWMGQTFKNRFKGQASSVWGWFRNEIPATLRHMRLSFLVMLFVGLVAAAWAFYYIDVNIRDMSAVADPGQIDEVMNQLEKAMRTGGLSGVSATGIFFNNLRAMVVALLLGLFSFGVGGVMVYLINAGLIGAVLAVTAKVGFSPWTVFFAGILPHGVFELTAVILASAAVLHLGVSLVTPDRSRTFGQVYIESIADWLKILAGVVIPLLIVASLIETTITPYLLIRFLQP